MKRSVAIVVFLAGTLVGGTVPPPAAWGGITIEASLGYLGDPSASVWKFRLTADAPILAIGNLSLDKVHQVSCAGMDCLFAGDSADWHYYGWQAFHENLDTHLLVGRSWVSSISGSWITETNDLTDPLDIASGQITAGVGTLGAAPNGMMTFFPQYQTSSLEFLQALPADFGTLRMTVQTTDGKTYRTVIGPYTLEGPCGYYCPMSYDFGNVRVGMTATKDADIAQAGTCWDNFDGTILENVVAPFSRDAKNVYFSPQARGPVSCQALAAGIHGDWPGQMPMPMSGCGVGPVFDASRAPDSTIEFGQLSVDSFFDVLLDIRNITGDAELGDLTRLTVEADVEGDGAAAFSVVGPDRFELAKGQTGSLRLRFNAADQSLGNYLAQLLLRTDVGAVCGATDLGAVYRYTLSGAVVPEPSTFVVLLGLSTFGVLRFARRSKSD